MGDLRVRGGSTETLIDLCQTTKQSIWNMQWAKWHWEG